MATLVQEYITNSAQKFPRSLSAVFREERMTYKELDESSNRLARFLQGRGVLPGDRVAFCLHKSIDSLVALVAILKADAIYVPLNAKAPADRIRRMAEDAEPRLILCERKTESLVRNLGAVFCFESMREKIAEFSSGPIAYTNTGDAIAYILYTSGSTGIPKGVMIRHANIINATEWAVEELGITHEDRISQHPPLHFDLSTFDLYCAFKSGATLYLVPEELSLFPAQLLKFMEERELTIWNSVPSVMVQLYASGALHAKRLPKLKKVFFNGEGFPTKFLAAWMRLYPDKQFVNMYGPTETTVQCTFYRVNDIPTDESKLVPIGKPCRNVEVFAIDEHGARASIGHLGELYIEGRGVGAGYWRDSEHTKAAFVPHPLDPARGIVYKTGDLVRLREDGNYDFIGRKDNQVKVRGNRIELGDVDAALYSLPYVKEAAAVAIADPVTNGNRLIAFLDLEEKEMPLSIKEDLAKLLPAYMIPDEIVIRTMPKTSTGKIDRAALKESYARKN